MKLKAYFPLVVILMLACNKVEPDDSNNLPDGATPFTEADLQFVPYTSSSLVFKKLPGLDSTLTLNFVERKREEDFFAYDQTFFNYSTDAALQAEFRLRYLYADNTQKTLAMYLPYRDAANNPQTNLFEIPISTYGLESGFFKNLVDFHDTLILNSVMWFNVYEVTPLVSTDSDKDGPQNYNRVFYNKTYGLIKMIQKNGTEWLLQQ